MVQSTRSASKKAAATSTVSKRVASPKSKVTKNKKPSEKSIEEIEKDLDIAPVDEEKEENDNDDDESNDDDFNSDEEAGLEGFSSDSDEEEEPRSKEDKEESKANIIPKSHSVKKAITKTATTTSSKNKNHKGVIYVGRIPHGFYEEELRKYFKQFGDITRLRLSRNKKTGKSKHYGFIEFEQSDVAKIAAETMDNYLLFGHLLKVSLLQKEQIHDDLFQGSNTKYKVIPWAKIAQKKNDTGKSLEKWSKIVKADHARKTKKQNKLTERGIDFDLSKLN